MRLKRGTFTGTTSGVAGVPNGTPFVDFAAPVNGSVTISLHVDAPTARAARAFSVRILAGD